jgi:hypothetical protein
MANNGKRGVGFLGLLTIVFIVLKLTGTITWSWLWVLAPTWIPMVAGLIVVIISALIYAKYKIDGGW